jgi:hypothetical protein
MSRTRRHLEHLAAERGLRVVHAPLPCVGPDPLWIALASESGPVVPADVVATAPTTRGLLEELRDAD